MSNQIREVKEATDIVQVIGERLQLQRAGRNLKALCPFHSEKSPSFFVSPEIQVFRCFGCGERGDVFTFLQKYEGLTFAEALKLLAEKAGITLTEQHFTPEDNRRDRLLQILDLTRSYYHFLLTEHRVGEKGRQYLADRGVTKETIKEFQLGFAAPTWDGLIKYLYGKKKYSLDDLLAAGLIIPRNAAPRNSSNPRDYYDRFRDRIIFPLTDHRGRVVGFSGRVLNPEEKTAKYINSPETLLYHKSELLFGFSQHHRALREAQTAIVVEGEFDVLSSAQAHVRNVVAIKGSALTKEHVQRLQRVVNTIVLSLDADNAGVEATKRAIAVAQEFDVRIKVLPNKALGGKDPDDIAKEHPKLWRDHVKQAISAYQFLINTAVSQHDIQTGEGKQAVVAALADVLQSIPHVIEQSHYIEELAKQLHVSVDMLRKDVSSYRLKSNTPDKKTEPQTSQEWSAREKTEAYIVGEIARSSEADQLLWLKNIDGQWFSHQGLRQVIEFLQKNSPVDVKHIAQRLPAELQPLFGEVYLQFHDQDEVEMTTLYRNVIRLRELFFQQHEKQLTQQLAALVPDKSSAYEQQEQELLIALQQLREQMKNAFLDPALVKYSR